MKKLLSAVVALLALLAPASAAAHPLGNFTINRYAELLARGDRLYVVYVLDLAEIPAFQARREGVDAGEYAATIGERLVLRVDGRRVPLRPAAQTLRSPRGAGGLRTLRLEALYEGPRLARAAEVELRDHNYRGRLGWHEVVARGDGGARLSASTVPARSVTDRLRRYPRDLLASPLAVRAAVAHVEPGPGTAERPTLAGADAADRSDGDAFARLVESDLGPLGLLAALAVALFWGAAHALSPGHGKAIVTAYLVGTRGAARHAFALGGIVTVTHTIGVFALGVVTLALSQFVVPEQLYPWLGLVSGLLVVGIGASVLRARWRHRHRHARGHHHHHDHHPADHHGHDDAGGHSHSPAEPGWRGLLAVGVSGGLLPCPSALVVLLAAISLHKVALGLLLIVAFSVGLAATITAIGLAALLARRLFREVNPDGRVVRLLPSLSALVIVVAGVDMTARALPGVV